MTGVLEPTWQEFVAYIINTPAHKVREKEERERERERDREIERA